MKVDRGYASVFRVMGWLLLALGIIMCIPLVVEICDGEEEWLGFVVAISGSLIIGGALTYGLRFHHLTFRRREGFMLVSLVWILFSAFGMIPFVMGNQSLGFSDAYFETMSGFTTTGATTIADVESLSKGVLLWRSMTQWIGGLGIILFMLALLPALNEKGGLPMYNAETTGITHDKLHPQIQKTAGCLWLVYLVITIVSILLLWAGPMTFFDAVCQSFTTIATGGFSTRNDGIAYWNSDYVNVVLTGVMFLGGVNFALLYTFCQGKFRDLLKNDCFHWYMGIVFVIYLGIFFSLLIQGKIHSFSDAVITPMFHVVSAITTTGFGLPGFPTWGSCCLLLTMILMMAGGCAGSTAGAMKVDRIVAMHQNLQNEIRKALNPQRVYSVKVNGKVVKPEEMAKISAFMTIYVLLTVAGALFLSAFDINLVDAFFASISCIGDNGLGWGITGAAGGYHNLPDVTKWFLSFLMLAGRLELFSVLVLFAIPFWKK